jgi:hypothetical protein
LDVQDKRNDEIINLGFWFRKKTWIATTFDRSTLMHGRMRFRRTNNNNVHSLPSTPANGNEFSVYRESIRAGRSSG